MTANSSSSADISPIRVGDKIDKYVITQQIGAGGMSIVWKGHDPLLDKFVAIKQMTPVPGEREAMRERFVREGALQKKVSQQHKHLVQVFDLIDEPRGMFIVMEYVDGQSLEQLLASNTDPLEERQALGIVGAVALALDVIHKNNVIHRDLKPSNILLPKGGGLKVADFGLATLVEQQESLSVGSVRYMAPELFLDGQVDSRADIYSLGLIAYEMLAGRAKFEDAFKIVLRDQRNQALRWMKWHTNTRAKAPALDQLNPAVSSKLSDLVARMMEKDPAVRVQSANELLAAIRRHFTAGAPEQVAGVASSSPAAAASPAEKTAPLPKRSKLPAIFGAILCAQILIGGAVYYGVSAHQKNAVEDLRNKQGIDQYGASYKTFCDAVDLSKSLRGNVHPGEEDIQRVRDMLNKAKAGFDQLANDWNPSTDIGKKSRAESTKCDVYLQMDARDFDGALASLDKVEAINAFGNTDRAGLETLRQIIGKRSAFEKAIEDIQTLLKQSQFAQARTRIAEMRQLGLADVEKARIEELGARVEDQVNQYRVNEILNRAQTIAAGGDRDGAIDLLTDALNKYHTPSIEKKLTEMVSQRNYDRVLADATSTEGRNNIAKTIDAYTKVLALRPGDEKIENKIKELKSMGYRVEARRLLADGNTDAARQAYVNSLIVENDEARKALGQIEATGQKSKYIADGDSAITRGELDAAILQYQFALKFGDDPIVSEKIRAAKFAIALKQARDALSIGQLDKARDAVKAASDLKPVGDTEVARVTEGINRRSQYQKFIDEGDKARAESRFVDAKAAYRKAIDISSNVPAALSVAQKRLDDTEYDHLIAQSKSYIESQRWPMARATLMTAKKLKDLPEVKDLMDKVNDADPLPTKKTSDNN